MCNCKNPIITGTKDKPNSNIKIELILKQDGDPISNQMCSNKNRLKPNLTLTASRSSTINTANVLNPNNTSNYNNINQSSQGYVNHIQDNAKYFIESPSLKRRPIFDKLNQRLHSHNKK